MQELRSKLGPAGYKVTMSVPAKYKDSPSSAWIGAFDYYALGKVCDQIMLMTYDQHTSGTGARACRVCAMGRKGDQVRHDTDAEEKDLGGHRRLRL